MLKSARCRRDFSAVQGKRATGFDCVHSMEAPSRSSRMALFHGKMIVKWCFKRNVHLDISGFKVDWVLWYFDILSHEWDIFRTNIAKENGSLCG